MKTTTIFLNCSRRLSVDAQLGRQLKIYLKGNFYRAEVLIKSYPFYCGRMIQDVGNAADALHNISFLLKRKKLK